VAGFIVAACVMRVFPRVERSCRLSKVLDDTPDVFAKLSAVPTDATVL
jgi:hypothetical protein